MPRQLSFPLPVRPALGREDFFVSAANSAALAMIDNWQNWPERKLMLLGPEGSGKSHLAGVWAEQSAARVINAADLQEGQIPELVRAPVAVENCDRAAGKPAAERALFHLHNLALAEGQSLLLTARTPSKTWSLTLPDLASRMQATPIVTINEPDDALLLAVLTKLFQDRQIVPPPDLGPYLLRRIDRSFAAAHAVVETLDAAGLDAQHPLTRAFARKVLDKAAR
ncbi:MAG: chromosomal replication initiator DnaA [Pseudomonadota bacterium]